MTVSNCRAGGLPLPVHTASRCTLEVPPQVDLGPPVSTAWSARTLPSLTAQPNSDPLLSTFQQELHDQAYQFVFRPFAAGQVNLIPLTRIQIGGVTKYASVTGTLDPHMI